MSIAHQETLALGVVLLVVLVIFFLALRLRLRTGKTDPWLYAAPALCVVIGYFMVITAHGGVIDGR